MLLGQENSTDTGTLIRLGRHLAALKSSTQYRAAFHASVDTEAWISIARFFSNAFEHGGVEGAHC